MACPFYDLTTFDTNNKDDYVSKDDHQWKIQLYEEQQQHLKKDAQWIPCSQSLTLKASLSDEDLETHEDIQTLTLKHLRDAVLILTNPSILTWIVLERVVAGYLFTYAKILTIK